MKISRFFLIVLVIGSLLAAPWSAGAQESGWRRYDDPSGISLDYPATWLAGSEQGVVVVVDPLGTSLFVAYAFEPEMGYTAEQCVNEMAVSFQANLTDLTLTSSEQTSISPDERVATMSYTAVDGEGFASMVCWINGAQGLVYLAAIPISQYTSMWPVILRITESITLSEASSTPAAIYDVGITYETWTDPLEGAFTLEAPRGWHIAGGMLDIVGNKRPTVQMISPDENVLVSIGVTDLIWFLQPALDLAQAGYTEGSVFFQQGNTAIMVLSYLSGGQAAQFLAEMLIAPMCSAFVITSARDLEDQSGFSADGTSYISAGEAAFTCTYQNQDVVGYYYVTTLAINHASLGEMWLYDTVMGYLALVERANEAGAVLTRAAQTFALTPKWVAAQQALVTLPETSSTWQFDPDVAYDPATLQILMDVQQMSHETSLLIIDNIDGYSDYEYVYDYDYGW